MASMKHSRFTDEVYATPVAVASKIDARDKNELIPEIFPSGYFEEFKEGLHTAEEVKTRDLFTSYPPNFKHKNKKFIMELLNTPHPYAPLQDKSILITRWKPFFSLIENVNIRAQIDFKFDNFTYIPDSDTHSTEWYLNFADHNLFRYYAGPLLAQDELQVLECVQLASLREYFSQAQGKDVFSPVGAQANTGRKMATPVLISNVERVIRLNVKNIYGNKFQSATEDDLREAFYKQEPPQTVNLIAIEALSYGQGDYTRDQIRFLLDTCYSGFKAAQILALKTFRLNKGAHISSRRGGRNTAIHDIRTIVHTGFWGCGAYGNNKLLILVVQCLAAHWAMIDKLVFHLQSDEYAKLVTDAQAIVDSLAKIADVNQVIEDLYNRKFQWDKSNST